MHGGSSPGECTAANPHGKTLKIILDEKERGGVDHRLDTYSEVYRRLTGRGVAFEFPISAGAEF